MGTEPENPDHDAHVKRRAIYRELFADMAIVVKRSVAEQRRINHTNGIPESPPEPVVRAVSSRRVNDPLLTDAEYIHQRSKRPDDPLVGKVWVASNEITRIGALAHIRRALDHHKRAAEWFKNAYEAMYGGIAPAIDMGKVRVDTSIMAHACRALFHRLEPWE